MRSRSGRRGLPMRKTTKCTLNMYGSETLGACISMHWAPRRPLPDVRCTSNSVNSGTARLAGGGKHAAE